MPTALATPPAALGALAARLNALCDALPFHTGWYLKDLRSGAEADRLGDEYVAAGSTRKVLIMMAALAAVQRGEQRLDEPVELVPDRYQTESGVFHDFAFPCTVSLRDAMFMMIVLSDSICTYTLSDLITLEAVDAYCAKFGQRNGRRDVPGAAAWAPGNGRATMPLEWLNATTPRYQGRAFDLILRGATGDTAAAAELGCSGELCQLALWILGKQKLNARLLSRLPREARVAHKTGSNTHRNCHDGGIVFRDEEPRFILTVFTEKIGDTLPDGTPANQAATRLIGNLGRECWDELGN